jgi:SAM-dependent methyltransferase
MTDTGKTADSATAYEGLEDANAFPDAGSVDRYRQMLLARSATQADFLVRRMPAPARLLEIACGNGRLLIELARRGVIAGGLGLDVARSRIAFAERWAADESCDKLEFVAAEALTFELPLQSFAAVLVITGAFAYFEPLASGSESRLAKRLFEALEDDGLLCLEIYPHPGYRRVLAAMGGKARIWTELPADDPWRFYLSDLSLDDSGEILTHEKTFIHRLNGRVDAGRVERLYLYTQERVQELLSGVSFRDVRFYEGWKEEPYQGGEVMVVTATK